MDTRYYEIYKGTVFDVAFSDNTCVILGVMSTENTSDIYIPKYFYNYEVIGLNISIKKYNFHFAKNIQLTKYSHIYGSPAIYFDNIEDFFNNCNYLLLDGLNYTRLYVDNQLIRGLVLPEDITLTLNHLEFEIVNYNHNHNVQCSFIYCKIGKLIHTENITYLQKEFSHITIWESELYFPNLTVIETHSFFNTKVTIRTENKLTFIEQDVVMPTPSLIVYSIRSKLTIFTKSKPIIYDQKMSLNIIYYD